MCWKELLHYRDNKPTSKLWHIKVLIRQQEYCAGVPQAGHNKSKDTRRAMPQMLQVLREHAICTLERSPELLSFKWMFTSQPRGIAQNLAVHPTEWIICSHSHLVWRCQHIEYCFELLKWFWGANQDFFFYMFVTLEKEFGFLLNQYLTKAVHSKHSCPDRELFRMSTEGENLMMTTKSSMRFQKPRDNRLAVIPSFHCNIWFLSLNVNFPCYCEAKSTKCRIVLSQTGNTRWV